MRKKYDTRLLDLKPTGKPVKKICIVCTRVEQGTGKEWTHEPHSYSHDYVQNICPTCKTMD